MYIYIPLFHSHLVPTKIAALQHPSLFGGVCTAQLCVLETCSRMNLTDQSHPKKNAGNALVEVQKFPWSIHQDKCELDMSGAATWDDMGRHCTSFRIRRKEGAPPIPKLWGGKTWRMQQTHLGLASSIPSNQSCPCGPRKIVSFKNSFRISPRFLWENAIGLKDSQLC